MTKRPARLITTLTAAVVLSVPSACSTTGSTPSAPVSATVDDWATRYCTNVDAHVDLGLVDQKLDDDATVAEALPVMRTRRAFFADLIDALTSAGTVEHDTAATTYLEHLATTSQQTVDTYDDLVGRLEAADPKASLSSIDFDPKVSMVWAVPGESDKDEFTGQPDEIDAVGRVVTALQRSRSCAAVRASGLVH
jgi:hypothetical protein